MRRREILWSGLGGFEPFSENLPIGRKLLTQRRAEILFDRKDSAILRIAESFAKEVRNTFANLGNAGNSEKQAAAAAGGSAGNWRGQTEGEPRGGQESYPISGGGKAPVGMPPLEPTLALGDEHEEDGRMGLYLGALRRVERTGAGRRRGERPGVLRGALGDDSGHHQRLPRQP